MPVRPLAFGLGLWCPPLGTFLPGTDIEMSDGTDIGAATGLDPALLLACTNHFSIAFARSETGTGAVFPLPFMANAGRVAAKRPVVRSRSCRTSSAYETRAVWAS